MTIQDATAQLLGPFAHFIVSTVQIIYNISIIITYMVVIIGGINKFSGINEIYLAIGLFIIYFPLAISKDFSKFTTYSLVALCIGIFVYCIIMTDAVFTIIEHGALDLFVFEKDFHFSLNSVLFGVMMFTYDINPIVTVARASMKEPKKFPNVLFYYVIFTYLITAFFGLLCTMAYGAKTESVIFSNLGEGKNPAFIVTVNALYSLAIIIDVVLLNFPLIGLINKSLKIDNEYYQMVSIALLFILEAIFAIVLSSAIRIANFMGAFLSVLLGIIFPILLYRKFYYFRITWPKTVLLWTLMIISIIGSGFGMMATFLG